MFSWPWAVLFVFISFVITVNTYSIYVHRALAHRVLVVGPGLTYFFRVWLWLTGFWYLGGSLRKFSAGHRKHHTFLDSSDDPHSPHFFSAKQIIFTTAPDPSSPYYMTPNEIVEWAGDVPVYNDWLEQKFQQYSKYKLPVMLILMLLLFGISGAVVGIVGFVGAQLFLRSHNYLSHKVGYRNRVAAGSDRSRNMFPIGILYGGEELAANHHDHPGNPKTSEKWWEFDIGWAVILVLRFLGLVKLRTDN